MDYSLNKRNWYREAKENYPKFVLLVKVLERKIIEIIIIIIEIIEYICYHKGGERRDGMLK